MGEVRRKKEGKVAGKGEERRENYDKRRRAGNVLVKLSLNSQKGSI